MHVRDLDASGAERDCVVDDRSNVIDVVTMNGRVDGERQAKLPHPARDHLFLLAAAFVAGDAVSVLRRGVDVLDRDLYVVEAGFLQLLQALARE